MSEPRSAVLRSLLKQDPDPVVWWFSEIECASALARLEREGILSGPAIRDSFEQLDRLRKKWAEVDAVPSVRRIARRLVRVHNLRAADAGQLAAALAASEGHTETVEFVCLDTQLNVAAQREGLLVSTFET